MNPIVQMKFNREEMKAILGAASMTKDMMESSVDDKKIPEDIREGCRNQIPILEGVIRKFNLMLDETEK